MFFFDMKRQRSCSGSMELQAILVKVQYKIGCTSLKNEVIHSGRLDD